MKLKAIAAASAAPWLADPAELSHVKFVMKDGEVVKGRPLRH